MVPSLKRSTVPSSGSKVGLRLGVSWIGVYSYKILVVF